MNLLSTACIAVTVPREQALDSEIFCGITEKGVEMAKKMRSGTQVAACPACAYRSTHHVPHRQGKVFLSMGHSDDIAWQSLHKRLAIGLGATSALQHLCPVTHCLAFSSKSSTALLYMRGVS